MFPNSRRKLHSYILFLLAVFIFSSSAAPQIARTSYKILGISVEGNKSADVNAIILNSGLKVGDEVQVPGDQTMNAIRRLWSLNIFSDVQIVIDKQISDGVFLLIKVEEYPRVEKVVVEGNDEISTSDIEAKINFIPGQILKTPEVVKLKQRILALYEEDGYLNARVTPKYYSFLSADSSKKEIKVTWRNQKDFSDEYVSTYDVSDRALSTLVDKIKERVLLKLEIEENDKVIVREIEFRGNHAFDDGDLKGEMDEIEESKWWKFWSSAKFDKKKFDEDKKLIINFYRKNGYRDAEIISDSLIYSNDKKDLRIVMYVHEGPQYKIRKIIWEGNTIYPGEFLTERLDIAPGDIYDYEKFNQNLRGNQKQSDIAALYLDNGYLTFNLKTFETKVAEDSIDLLIQIQEKNQFKVGQVDITGNTKTKDKVIRRELYTLPGDYFNRALLFRSLQQLANLQYFNVEKLYQTGVDYQLENDSTVNVVFNVEEKSSDYLNASVGYSGAFGFSGAVGITLTNFSITEPFSLGGGQILSFNWQFGVSSLYRTFSLGFTEPWLFDTPTLVGFELFDTRQAYYYDLRQSGGTLRLGRRLKWPDDRFYVQGFFRYQYNNILDGKSLYQQGIFNQYTVGLSISRRNIDNPIFPSQGSNLLLDGEISGGPFLPGDVNFYKFTFKSEWYNKLFNTNRITLYTVADLGYLKELTSNTSISPYEYFYMGGNGLVAGTIPLRGYDDPQSFSFSAQKGRVYTRYTTELRFAVALDPVPLYLLAFAEAGNVFDNLKNADLFDFRRSIGVGARMLINPIGLIGFDLGYGFDRRKADGKDPAWLFHFQFGRGF